MRPRPVPSAQALDHTGEVRTARVSGHKREGEHYLFNVEYVDQDEKMEPLINLVDIDGTINEHLQCYLKQHPQIYGKVRKMLPTVIAALRREQEDADASVNDGNRRSSKDIDNSSALSAPAVPPRPQSQQEEGRRGKKRKRPAEDTADGDIDSRELRERSLSRYRVLSHEIRDREQAARAGRSKRRRKEDKGGSKAPFVPLHGRHR